MLRAGIIPALSMELPALSMELHLYQGLRVQVPELRQVCSINESLALTYKKKCLIF